MCTLIVLDRIVPGFSLVVASNRDEHYARPAAPPARFDPHQVDQEQVGQDQARRAPSLPEGLAYVAPRDLQAGGTWMGVNARGLFVGLTNRPLQGRRRGLRSRGFLVRDLLSRGDRGRRSGARAVAEELEEQDLAGTYDPFHLLAADGRETFLTVLAEGGPVTTRELAPGVHVICNRDADDLRSGKVRALRREVEALDLRRPLDALLRDLGSVLAGHPDASNPLENPCVHTAGYGTRSSSLIALGPERRQYWHADGPPCQTPYENLTRLLDDLQPASPECS